MKIPATIALLCISIASCGKPATPPPADARPIPADFFLASAPADAADVTAAKAAAKVGDQVSIRGRIGGTKKPFVEGRGMFTLVGEALPACSDNPDDHCKTPWDYCCETKADIAANSATIQLVDAAGAPLHADLNGQHGVKELSELIVIGTVAQADGPVFVVNATAAYIVKP